MKERKVITYTYRGRIEKGGASKSDKKVAASVRNAVLARAARVRKYPRCPKYKNGSHRFAPDGRCYSPECRAKYPDLRREK